MKENQDRKKRSLIRIDSDKHFVNTLNKHATKKTKNRQEDHKIIKIFTENETVKTKGSHDFIKCKKQHKLGVKLNGQYK